MVNYGAIMIDTLVTAPPFPEDPYWGPGKGWGDSFRYQIDQHRKRCESLSQIDNPIDGRYDLYSSLSDLFDTGDHDRLALYVPFSLIPDMKHYRTVDDSVDRFIQCYVRAWRECMRPRVFLVIAIFHKED